MNEGNPAGKEHHQFVEVIHDYKYENKGQKYVLQKGEILMVHNHTTDIWWQAPVHLSGRQESRGGPGRGCQMHENTLQVIRLGERRAFYAPKSHLRPRSLSRDEKLDILSGQSTSMEKTVAAGKLHEIIRGGSFPPEEHLPSSPIKASQSSKPYQGPRHESLSSHTSKSSLNESSAESLEYSGKPGIKTGSVDELRSKGRTTQTLDVCKKRASSNEELDGRSIGSSDLSLRHRASSVDLRMTPQELSRTEIKQSSTDKTHKVRLSKDLCDRRRSWALDNRPWALESPRHSLKRGETVDAAIVLDVPPELPPKTKPKHRLSTFNSNPETISRLEGPIDLKVEQVRMAKSSQPPVEIELCGETETEKKHSRHSSDPLVLRDEKARSFSNQETHNGKDPPIALPRKLLPPQAPSLEGRAEGSMLLSDYTLRDANGNKVKKSSSHSSLSTPIIEGSGKGRELQGSFRQRDKACEPHHEKPSNNLEVTKDDNTTPPHKGKAESPKTRTVRSRFTGSLGSFRKNTKKETKEKEEREKELPARETPTPDSSRGGKLMQTPPSPRCPPQRTLSGDWGEYIDSASKRPYYYNSNTREKRWKPPRKGVPPSNSIPEVPTSVRSEDISSRGNVPPKCPTPDYPSSPRLSHKPFSYASIPEIPQFHPITRSATLNLSTFVTHSTTTPFSNTLPTNSASPAAHSMLPIQNTSKQKVKPLPLSSPPAVPPSSAKPTFPTTPTTPDCTEHSTLSEYKNDFDPLLDILHHLKLPKGWVKKYDAYTQRIYFHNSVTKERWLATTNDEGKVYYYEESGSKSSWRLPEVDAELLDPEQFPGQPLSPPQENLRLSYITENLHEFSDSIKREGFLHRTFYTRDGKKLRKNWTHSYARYIEHPINSGSTAFLYFSKTKDVEKKAEIFEFVTPCYLEHVSDKKTSRQQVLGLRNSNDTEVLLQFDDREIAQEWIKDLKTQKGMEYIAIPEKEEKKGKKGSEKIKRETSLEQLNPDNKGIKDKLRNFIKRRPMKETLEHKGIYKESVFGSTLAELKSQDKTNTPLFVLCCIKNIEDTEENLETDGLYRISGNAAQIQKIRFEVAQRRYTVLGQEKEIHNLTGALKLFFRELKEPLIPFDNYKEFIYATGSEYRKANQQADKLMKAVNKLPTENYETLMILMEHLLRVSKHEPQNRMSLSNLAIVFGPCIMWPRETQSADIMTNVMLHNRVVEGLLADFDKIFTKKLTM